MIAIKTWNLIRYGSLLDVSNFGDLEITSRSQAAILQLACLHYSSYMHAIAIKTWNMIVQKKLFDGPNFGDLENALKVISRYFLIWLVCTIVGKIFM